MDVSVIIVNYNTKEFLKNCLASCYGTIKDLQFEIFVVDNASSDGSALMVERDFPEVKLIKNTENAGFAKANNQAIARSAGKYVLLLNPDIVVYDRAITNMAEFLQREPRASAVGAQLLNPDGTVQVSGYYCKFPTVLQVLLFYTALRNLAFRITWLRHAFWQQMNTDDVCEVDQPPGACLMVKKTVIGQVGVLDEAFPIFFNDVDWCYRIRQSGGKIYYLPQARMLHYGGQSFISEDVGKKIQWSLTSYRGLERVFIKTGRPLQAKILKLILFLDSIVKFPAWAVIAAVRKDLRPKAVRVFRYNWAIISQWCLKGGQ
ncbi:MAG: glycosyltransferase family 2 protein [Candidatus Omnitrophica bacterium]|nr:glycosyltransferase family 2 protein [Candidatus Omnitrophota bacterium]